MIKKEDKKTAKSVTMADLLASHKSPIMSLSTGKKVKGKVVTKGNKSLILDIGAKSEGIVAEKAFAEARDYISKLKVGDEVLATVIFPETRDGSILLSLRDAIFQQSWDFVIKAMNEETPVAVFGKGVTQSGVSVDVNGLLGFIPSSQLGKEVSSDTQGLVGKYFKAKVLEVDRLKNKLVLSEKEVSEAENIALSKKAIKALKEGEVYDGIVTTVANYGAFVKIEVKVEKKEVGIEGLVHVSEMSWTKVGHPSEIIKEGQKVKVKVIGVKDGKLVLSMKQAQGDPWLEVGKKYKHEDKVSGKVVKQTDFGMFVELEPGIEGLVHITKIPHGKKFNSGDEVSCYIEEVDTKSRKISLGLVLTSIPVGYK